MLKDLFINATILIAAISFGNALMRDKLFSSPKIYVKMMSGLLSGALGCILMIFSVRVAPDIIIDFRNIPILFGVFYYSPISTIATSLTIGLFRILYFGLSASSATAFIIALTLGISCVLVSKLNIKSWVKWTLAVFLSCALGSAGFVFVMITSPKLLTVLAWYNIGVFVVSIAVYHLLSFHLRINDSFSKATEESHKDFLTGLFNPRYGHKAFNHLIRTAKEKSLSLSLLYVDIDDFKYVNDYYGHLSGDKVLKNVAAILVNESRSVDIVYRRGGDEFSIILNDCDLPKAQTVAARIRESVNGFEHLLDSGESITVTVSIGTSSYPATTDDGEKIIDQADKALYEAKQLGKNMIKAANELDSETDSTEDKLP